MRVSNRRGYTLIELVVTIMIIGVLASIAVPQYLQTVETGYADDAAATVNMIGTTNKMFALDHNGVYASGVLPIAGAGAGAVCGTTGTIPTGYCAAGQPSDCASAGTPSAPYNACHLVCCGYLADQDWGDKKYAYSACNGATGGGAGAGGGVTACAAGDVAAARRAATASSTYSGWSYQVLATGQIQSGGSAPPASF